MSQDVVRGPTDLQSLLLPISQESPTGAFLLYEGTYERIREARRADDPGLPRDIWQHDLKSADWGEVVALCVEALETRSKDLQIAAWLMEAAMHLQGFAGLRLGLEVLLGLSRRFWPDLYPPLDEDPEFRCAPFHWLNEKATPEVFGIPVVRPHGEPENSAPWTVWKQAIWLENLRAKSVKDPDLEQQLKASVTQAEFGRRVKATPRAFYEEGVRELGRALELTRELEGVLDNELGERSPSLVRFREALAELHGWMRTVLRGAPLPPPEVAEMESDHDAAPLPEDEVQVELEGERAQTPAAAGRFRTREEAYRTLREAALYLRSVEPHSPAPYLVLRAVAWGEKTLDDLLREFMKNGLDLAALATLLGLDEAPDS